MESKPTAKNEIEIPSDLKYVLKEYAKNLIRSQPEDLLQWSVEYFKAKLNEENLKNLSEIQQEKETQQ
ncbi:hypothetical protein CDAR_204441 [Caerostris darwini]|uniref:RIIa domain-containing protein n=1 Tax=Caerostris darwini TaxID=1538125 RepID=A0AAV4TDW5_9ARAC|nr:hypothetical protein CDAR_204441 [Caerostris darwini]